MCDPEKWVDENGWVYCPFCKAKTRIKIHPDTAASRWPLYCRKCGRETIVNIENMIVKLSSEPDAATPSR